MRSIAGLRRRRCGRVLGWTGLIVLLHIAVGGQPIRLIEGTPQMTDLLLRIFHPDFSVASEAGAKLAETFELAIFSTLMGSGISVVFAFLTAENLGVTRWIVRPLNALFSVFRTIPSLIWAAIFVTLFSIGQFSGFLALFVIAFFMSTKLLKEYIEAIPADRLDALRAYGATGPKLLAAGVLPKIRGLVVSVFFLCLETNIRSATVLGLVGAGGIGQILWRDLNFMRYDKVIVIVFLQVLAIWLIDTVSAWTRRRLSSTKSVSSPAAFRRGKRIMHASTLAVAIFTLWMLTRFVSVSFDRLLAGLQTAGVMLSRMAHPDWQYLPRGVSALMESLAIAAFATAVGTIIALPVVFVAARTTGVPRVLSGMMRWGINLLRTFPPILFAILYFRGVGPGAYSGALALTTYTVGTLAKMLLEVVEELPHQRWMALEAVGATPFRNYLVSIVPGVRSRLVGLVLYRMESNVRNSAIIGMIGAGGIGKNLSMNITWRNWEVVGLLLMLVALSVLCMDAASRWLRKKYTDG